MKNCLATAKQSFFSDEEDGLFGNIPRIPETVQEDSNKEITEQEIERAIKDLTPSKPPGVDGLGGEFYKVFSTELTPILKDVEK